MNSKTDTVLAFLIVFSLIGAGIQTLSLMEKAVKIHRASNEFVESLQSAVRTDNPAP